MTNHTAPTAFPSRFRAAGKTPAQWFALRRSELVEAAEASLDVAARMATYGAEYEPAVRDLMTEVRAMLAELAQIDGLR